MEKITRNRVYFTASVLLFVSLLLAREHLSGGVVTHHLLASADMPGISNWWGLLSLPLLAWVLFPVKKLDDFNSQLFGFSTPTMTRFAGAIVYGVAMGLSFKFDYDQATSALLFVLFPVGIVCRLYRGELIVGFVMGMTYTFGAIIPMAAAAIVAISSLILNTSARFVLTKLKK